MGSRCISAGFSGVAISGCKESLCCSALKWAIDFSRQTFSSWVFSQCKSVFTQCPLRKAQDLQEKVQGWQGQSVRMLPMQACDDRGHVHMSSQSGICTTSPALLLTGGAPCLPRSSRPFGATSARGARTAASGWTSAAAWCPGWTISRGCCETPSRPPLRPGRLHMMSRCSHGKDAARQDSEAGCQWQWSIMQAMACRCLG